MRRVVAFVPVKLNNERLPGKNTKAFDGGKPLIQYILNTLKETRGIDEIYVYCSEDAITSYLPKGVRYLSRSKKLDSSKTMILEVLEAFAKEVEADTYVLAHATAPFLSSETIEAGIEAVTSKEYDSALTVTPCHDFLWMNGKPFNYDAREIPRTQDLKEMYIETTGLYVFGRDLLLKEHRRTGDHPYLISVPREEAIDINEPIDFVFANAWYQQEKRKKK